MIELTIEDPDSCRVLFPAREHDTLDWGTLNKLTMNKDFQELLMRVKNDLQTKEIIKEKYDKIPRREELLKAIPKKD